MPEIDWVTILREGGLVAVIGVGLVVALIIYAAKWVPPKPPKEDPVARRLDHLSDELVDLRSDIDYMMGALGIERRKK